MRISYFTKLRGTTFEGRQEVIASLKGDEKLIARREPDKHGEPSKVKLVLRQDQLDAVNKRINDDAKLLGWDL